MRTLTISASDNYPSASFQLPLAFGKQIVTLNWYLGIDTESSKYELVVQSQGENNKATGLSQALIVPLAAFTINNPEVNKNSNNEETADTTFGITFGQSFVDEFVASRFIISDPNYQEYLDMYKIDAYAQIASDRYDEEVSGYTINGMIVATNRESKALLTANTLKANMDPTFVAKWKMENGFVTLNASQIIAISDAVRDFTQTLFDKEGTLKGIIQDLTVLTYDQYKTALSQIDNDYKYNNYVYLA